MAKGDDYLVTVFFKRAIGFGLFNSFRRADLPPPEDIGKETGCETG